MLLDASEPTKVACGPKSMRREREANVVVLNLPQWSWRKQRRVVVVGLVHNG